MTWICHHLTYTYSQSTCSLVRRFGSFHCWIQVFQPTVQPASKKAAWCAFKAASLKDLASICTVWHQMIVSPTKKYWDFCLLLVSKPNKKRCCVFVRLRLTVGVRERPPAICLSDGSCAGETRTKASRQSKKSIRVGQCLHPDPPEWERLRAFQQRCGKWRFELYKLYEPQQLVKKRHTSECVYSTCVGKKTKSSSNFTWRIEFIHTTCELSTERTSPWPVIVSVWPAHARGASGWPPFLCTRHQLMICGQKLGFLRCLVPKGHFPLSQWLLEEAFNG